MGSPLSAVLADLVLDVVETILIQKTQTNNFFFKKYIEYLTAFHKQQDKLSGYLYLETHQQNNNRMIHKTIPSGRYLHTLTHTLKILNSNKYF